MRLCNLPNYALDRLSRYEATLWRQAGQTLFALDNLDRRKPQERMRRMSLSSEQALTGIRIGAVDLWSLVYSLILMRIEGRTAANDLADDFKFGSRFR